MNLQSAQSGQFDSVYPDFLRTGLGKLGELDSRRELVSLFSALEHFRHDLHQENDSKGILSVTHYYVAGLNLFEAVGVPSARPREMVFQLGAVATEAAPALLERVAAAQIQAGRFALASRRGAPVLFEMLDGPSTVRGMLHGMTLSSQAVGMFCGLLQKEPTPATDVAHSLLSLLLGECADALATLRKTKQLTTEVETLSGLLPLCAWCKKVRNDSGYWEQIDHYLDAHSSAHLTHGVCPDCKKSFLSGVGKK